MNSVHRVLVLLFAIYDFVQPSSPSAEDLGLPHGNVKVGGTCKRDYNCIENAFCRVQLTCLCEPFYAPSPDGGTCIATSGLFCDDDSTCRTMTNGHCKQGVCTCKDSFMLDINNSSNCIPRPSKVDDRCQRNDDCEDSLERALCIDGKCRCITGHHFANGTEKCIKSRGLFQACVRDYDCFLHDNAELALICRNNECVCRDPGNPHCNKGSFPGPPSMIAVLLLLVVSAMISA